MNNDIISRSALKDFINKVCFSKEEEWVKFRVDNGSRGQIERILTYIDNAPTVDNNEYNRGFMHAMIMVGKEAEDRPTGYWKDHRWCSNCGCGIPTDVYGTSITEEEAHFCVECGASMRGGKQ